MAKFDAENVKRKIKEELEITLPKTINIRLDEMNISDSSPELNIDCRCSEGDRWKCKRAIRREIILELIQKGYLNEKFIKTKNWF